MISCYVIGELSTIEILRLQIDKFPLTTLTGYSNNPSKDIDLILKLRPQIVFVDTSLIEKNKPILFHIAKECTLIYLSESATHAYDAFEVLGFDYLLKPHSYERFEMSINKFIQVSLSTTNVKPRQVEHLEPITESFFIKVDKKGQKEVLIKCNEILYIEADQNYVFLHMIDGQQYICHNTMKEMEKSLPISYFIRVHKSFIINYDRVTGIERNRIIVDNDPKIIIHIGNTYKKAFFERKNQKIIKKHSRHFLSHDYYSSSACLLFFITNFLINLMDMANASLQLT
jgi:two-component system LytT family response regulator